MVTPDGGPGNVVEGATSVGTTKVGILLLPDINELAALVKD
jgi:hypothetical protein